MRKSVTAAVAGIALVGGAVAAGGISGPGASAAPVRGGTAPAATGDLDLPTSDEQLGWVGSPSRALLDLEDVVAVAAGQHEDVFAGSEYTRDYSALVVFATDLGAPQVAELKAAIAGKAGAKQVRFTQVEYSMDELVAATESIDLAAIPGAVSTGPDLATNSVTLGRDDSKGTGAGPEVGMKLRLSDPRVHANRHGHRGSGGRQIPDAELSDIPVRVHRDRAHVEAAEDRYDDAAPNFTMGAAIFSSGARCSLGVPLTVNGTSMALTAGHCTGTTHTNQAGATVGTLYTTTFQANAGIYGDWKLIKGQHYNLSAWSGDAHGSATLPMVGALWSTKPVGTQMCTSGSTTGQVCRFVVRKVNDLQYVSGLPTGKMTMLDHDSDLNGVSDCDGFGPGDSGGPAYYSNGNGGVIANGIITGSSPGPCGYWYTQLSGVQAWNSSVAFG